MVHAYRSGGMLRVDSVQLHHPAGEKLAIFGVGGPGAEGGGVEQQESISTVLQRLGILTVLRAATSMTMTNRSPV